MATITHPNLEQVTYRYGDHGLPISLESSLKGRIVSAATYNALGKIFDLTIGNGLTTSYRYWGLDYGGYSNYGLLRSVVTGSAQGLTYDTYDLIGNVKKIIDGRNGNESIEFTYDDLDRLTRGWTTPFSYDESYSYSNIGTFDTGSKPGGAYTYPQATNPRPHAPLTVAGQNYAYDANGNLNSADNGDRTYEYDVENRLFKVKTADTSVKHTMAYDGDGALRSWTNDAGQKMVYVTADYQVKLVNGQPPDVYVYYRFGGRGIAWRSNTDLRYLLADHLSSSHGEVGADQVEKGQRRYLPFGSDRAVPGASDIADEERYTSQHRIDAGVGYPRRELYYYRARWYLPGVGIFTQPDTIVPAPNQPKESSPLIVQYTAPGLLKALNESNLREGNAQDATGSRLNSGRCATSGTTVQAGSQTRQLSPQMLNRYAYVANNPVNYFDPDGFERRWVQLGQGWTGGIDEISYGDGFEIHLYDASKRQVGIVQGRQGWVGRHGFPPTRPSGIPDEVLNAVNGLNVKELRRRALLPGQFRRLSYLNPGRILSTIGNAIGIATGFADDAAVSQRASERGRDFKEQLMYELREQNPRYLISPFGVIENPLFEEIENS